MPTIVFNAHHEEENGNLRYCRLDPTVSVPAAVCAALYNVQIQSVLIEGGSQLLQSFIDAGLWDEARVISNNQLIIGKGTVAPTLGLGKLYSELTMQSDKLSVYSSPMSICG